MGFKRTREELGPNPNPEIWMDVRTKDGWYRKKRAKKRKLNEVMRGHADAFEMMMPVTKKIIDKLEPWVRGLELGRIRVTIAARLKKSYLDTGSISFKYLQDLDLQPRRTMKMVLMPRPYVKVTDEVSVSILTCSSSIKVKGSAYTEYYFELIMLWVLPPNPIPPNPLKGEQPPSPLKGELENLRVDSVESPLYPRNTEETGYCKMSIDVPDTKGPWMALLKVGCLEGNEVAYHPRHYGLKVVAVGGN